MDQSTEWGAASSAMSHLHSKNAKKRGTPILQQLGDHVPSSLHDGKVWGRQGGGRSWLGSLFASAPVVVGPLTSISTYITLTAFGGSYADFLAAVMKEGFWNICVAHGPQPTLKCVIAVIAWVAFQAVLFMWLPGEIHTGQYTPAGHLLSYRINGLSAWIVSNIVYGVLSWYGIIDPGFIPRNWGGLIAVMNIAGLTVSALAFMKAYLSPTHPNDRKFSGSFIYDYYMGIELNPRIGNSFDFKLFTNGRVGMMIWTFVYVSNMAYQYQTQGYIERSLILVSILQALYVVDFFINESWYLRTIDIAHDHYGFYLAWGCFCFLPTTYTIQAQYLGMYPSSLPDTYLAAIFITGLAGYALFRSANDQKDKVRATGGQYNLWGKPAEYVVASYRTTDGKQHKSLLVCSGWWGFSRHANYVGDLLLSYSACALVGTTKIVVWTYAIFMTMILIHRCLRDERRCSAKYGPAWTEYCKRVPWRFVPGIW